MKADLEGYPGHGLSRIPQYVASIRKGITVPGNVPKVIREGKTTALLDGNRSFGQVAAKQGMSVAISKAREHGTGIVSVSHVTHAGRLADCVKQAADEGMVGFAAICVGAGSITPYGGMEAATGTNPLAFGIPGRGGRHLVVDFATSAISMGELNKMAAAGKKIPEGVMLDSRGNPITDHSAFLGPPRGSILPFGGYKGYGLNLVVEVLGGVLTGHGLGKEWWERGGHQANGLFLEAFEVKEFQPLEAFYDKIDELTTFVKSRKVAPGFTEILLPGEASRRREAKGLREGVDVSETIWNNLTKLAKELGVEEQPKSLGPRG